MSWQRIHVNKENHTHHKTNNINRTKPNKQTNIVQFKIVVITQLRFLYITCYNGLKYNEFANIGLMEIVFLEKC